MDTGAGWTIASGAFAIQSNKAQVSDGGGTFAFASAEASHSDVTASVDWVYATGNQSATGTIIGRASDSSNYIGVGIGSGNVIDLYTIVAGTYTSRATSALSPTAGNLYTIQVIYSGTSITATVNGANTTSYSTSFNQTATKFGLRSYTNGSTCTYDNFLVTA